MLDQLKLTQWPFLLKCFSDLLIFFGNIFLDTRCKGLADAYPLVHHIWCIFSPNNNQYIHWSYCAYNASYNPKEEAEVKISNSVDSINIHATYEADVGRCLKKLRVREIARSYKSDDAPGEDIIEPQSFLVKQIVHERSPMNIASILLIIIYVVIITLKDAIIINVIFSILFGLEIVFRCYLLGKERYLRDPNSQFDIFSSLR